MWFSKLTPFFATFHYVEFWVTIYTSRGCPPGQFFLPTSAMESKTFCGFLISYMVPIMVGVWSLPDCLPFLAKFHYVEFWMTSSTSGGCLPKYFFSPTSAMERKTVYGFLISYTVPIMVGVWVYQIVYLFRKDSIKFEFWVTSYTSGGCLPKHFFLPTSALEGKTFCGSLISYMVPIMVVV